MQPLRKMPFPHRSRSVHPARLHQRQNPARRNRATLLRRLQDFQSVQLKRGAGLSRRPDGIAYCCTPLRRSAIVWTSHLIPAIRSIGYCNPISAAVSALAWSSLDVAASSLAWTSGKRHVAGIGWTSLDVAASSLAWTSGKRHVAGTGWTSLDGAASSLAWTSGKRHVAGIGWTSLDVAASSLAWTVPQLVASLSSVGWNSGNLTISSVGWTGQRFEVSSVAWSNSVSRIPGVAWGNAGSVSQSGHVAWGPSSVAQSAGNLAWSTLPEVNGKSVIGWTGQFLLAGGRVWTNQNPWANVPGIVYTAVPSLLKTQCTVWFGGTRFLAGVAYGGFLPVIGGIAWGRHNLFAARGATAWTTIPLPSSIGWSRGFETLSGQLGYTGQDFTVNGVAWGSLNLTSFNIGWKNLNPVPWRNIGWGSGAFVRGNIAYGGGPIQPDANYISIVWTGSSAGPAKGSIVWRQYPGA